MSDQQYERDVLAWGEHQAELLRCLSRGEKINEAPDWVHVIAEIEEVGLLELRACRSLLVQAMAHLAKLHLRPEAEAAGHWRAETAAFLASARRSFAPSMHQRIDLGELWQDAVHEIRAETEAGVLPPLPDTCPWTLDLLLSERPDPRDLQAAIRLPGQG